MKNRVFGIIAVGCKNSNWNADFTGNPKQYLDEYVASPFALKYAIREYWEQKGFKVYYRTSYKTLKGKSVPNNLEERYLALYETEKLPKNIVDFQNNVFSAIDVMNFGGVFPINDLSSSFTGAVQITTGVNKYDGAETVRDVVLSRFQNSNKANNEVTTLGGRYILTEGHFFYGFTINPACYDYIKTTNSDFSGYTEDAYNAFKEASLYAVNNINSLSKIGCYNEFSMFVKLKEDSLKLVSNLNDTVKFTKSEDLEEDTWLDEIDITTTINDLIVIADDIESIEIFYNPQLITLKYELSELDKKIKKYNILNPKIEV